MVSENTAMEQTKKTLLSRRGFLLSASVFTTATALAAAVVSEGDRVLHPTHAHANNPATAQGDPRPVDPHTTLLELMRKYPLVAVGEAHLLQEQHDFFATLLHTPRIADTINAIVVEFGNARYQDIADTFVFGKPVANNDLKRIWRNTVITGGNTVWDAPVYEQFFRMMREINSTLPAHKRIRVLLGDPPIDWSTVQTVNDWAQFVLQRDAHYVSVVEREVLQKGLHALLIAGNGHFLRGLRADGDPSQPSTTWPFNAGTILNQKYPGKLFVINPLLLFPGQQDRTSQLVTQWHAPALALLAHTWLAEQPVPASERNVATTLGAMCDAVIYFGGVDVLTASRQEPALYQCGEYAAEVQRRGQLLVQWGVQEGDPLKNDLHQALLGPSYYAQ